MAFLALTHRPWARVVAVAANPGRLHTRITKGAYRLIRHPMYASIWLWGIAQTLLLQNWIAGWASLVLFLPMYVLRVPREEQLMLEQFGEAYRAYMNQTRRIIPHFRSC